MQSSGNVQSEFSKSKDKGVYETKGMKAKSGESKDVANVFSPTTEAFLFEKPSVANATGQKSFLDKSKDALGDVASSMKERAHHLGEVTKEFGISVKENYLKDKAAIPQPQTTYGSILDKHIAAQKEITSSPPVLEYPHYDGKVPPTIQGDALQTTAQMLQGKVSGTMDSLKEQLGGFAKKDDPTFGGILDRQIPAQEETTAPVLEYPSYGVTAVPKSDFVEKSKETLQSTALGLKDKLSTAVEYVKDNTKELRGAMKEKAHQVGEYGAHLKEKMTTGDIATEQEPMPADTEEPRYLKKNEERLQTTTQDLKETMESARVFSGPIKVAVEEELPKLKKKSMFSFPNLMLLAIPVCFLALGMGMFFGERSLVKSGDWPSQGHLDKGFETFQGIHETKDWAQNKLRDCKFEAAKVYDNIRNFQDDAKEWVEDKLDSGKIRAHKAVDNIRDFQGDAKEWVEDKLDTGKIRAHKAVDNIRDFPGDAKEWVEDKFHDGKTEAENAYDKSTNTIQDGAHIAQEKLRESVRAAKCSMNQAKDTASEAVQDMRHSEKDTMNSASDTARAKFHDHQTRFKKLPKKKYETSQQSLDEDKTAA